MNWRKRECVHIRKRESTGQRMSSSCVLMMSIILCVQDALSAEINNLGVNYGKESSVSANEHRNNWSQTFVDREQFLRW